MKGVDKVYGRRPRAFRQAHCRLFGGVYPESSRKVTQKQFRQRTRVEGYSGHSEVLVYRVGYSDGYHPEDCPGGVDLWPREADGGGKSLRRKRGTDYGSDPDNWTATIPSPGL